MLASSRWYRPVARYAPSELEDQPDLIAEVSRQTCDGASVLFPCTDALVAASTSIVRPEGERPGSHLTDPGVLARLLRKDQLAETAHGAGVPVPETTPVVSGIRLQQLDDRWFRRSLIKPVDSQRFFRRFGTKSFPVASRSEAAEAVWRAGEAGLDVVLQRYVPGPPGAHLFLDGFRARTGETKGILARRRERMYPPTTGNSSAMVTVGLEEVPTAVEHLERLLDGAGYHGIFSAEFKEDADDGTMRLLEVNVRPWWYVEFTARCGVDVCAMAYREALGEPVESADSYDVGRRCVYPYYDLFAGWNELRSGRLGPWEWARSWLGSDRPVFAKDDPVPALRAAWHRVREALTRRVRGGQ